MKKYIQFFFLFGVFNRKKNVKKKKNRSNLYKKRIVIAFVWSPRDTYTHTAGSM